MEVIKEFNNNELTFDNLMNDIATCTLEINSETIVVNYNDIIDSQFSCGNVGQEIEKMKGILNLGIYSKAPCGGFLNFYRLTGSQGNEFVIYSGVNEVSNSHYIVTIHKVLEYPARADLQSVRLKSNITRKSK